MKDVPALSQALAQGEITSEEIVGACFETIEEQDPTIHAFVRTYREEALREAAASDARRAKGDALSPLDGLPVAIKDHISYADHLTSAGSLMLADYEAPYDATVVTKLKAAGAVIIGQTNMDEFAMGSSGENSAFGPTRNPHDLKRVPGGSSSGAAAAVAAGMVPLGLGSDTGGSIRQPAAFCGVVGLKPTYGAVSRYGLMAMASSLDQIGPIAATVSGVRMAYEVIRGVDRRDSTSEESPKDRPTKDHYTFGVAKQFVGDGLDRRIRTALENTAEKLVRTGHKIIWDIDLPLLGEAIAIYYLIMGAEVSANLARYDGIRFGSGAGGDVEEARTSGFGPEVKRRIMLGTFALSAGYADQYYKRAQTARAALTQELLASFNRVDLLLGPTTPELPFLLGAKSDDPLTMYLSDIYTVPVNLAGLPALSVPAAFVNEEDRQLPVGLQLIGPPWSEGGLFAAGEAMAVSKGIGEKSHG